MYVTGGLWIEWRKEHYRSVMVNIRGCIPDQPTIGLIVVGVSGLGFGFYRVS